MECGHQNNEETTECEESNYEEININITNPRIQEIALGFKDLKKYAHQNEVTCEVAVDKRPCEKSEGAIAG